MQTLETVIIWCICPVFTVVMTMQELSVLEWACFKPVHEASTFLDKWNCLKVHLLWQALKRVHKNWSATGEVTTTHRAQVLSLWNPRARPWCRLVLFLCKCVTFRMCNRCYPLWPPVGQLLKNSNSTTWHRCSFQSVTKHIGPYTVLLPWGKSELNICT